MHVLALKREQICKRRMCTLHRDFTFYLRFFMVNVMLR